MTSPAALRLVRTAPAFRERLNVSLDLKGAHSLHHGIAFPSDMPPQIANYLVQRFSTRTGVVLDPFCGSGTSLLEAAVLGRIVVGAELDPLGAKLALAKLAPADLTEITLGLQLLNLRKPVDLKLFSQSLSPFFDIETFRELINLRAILSDKDDHVHRFIEFVTCSILHGHTVGYLSTYTFPQISVSPEEQVAINRKRQQQPEYRALAPRILRKTAGLLSDGVPSVARAHAKQHLVKKADARDLSFLESGSVQLLFSSPPTPFQSDFHPDLWLRYWFTQLSPSGYDREIHDVVDWVDYMNEVLLEAARVVELRGRVALDLPELKVRDNEYPLDEILADSVQANLARFWEVEGVLSYSRRHGKPRDCIRGGGEGAFGDGNRILVLRRR